jgi:hypothetical protein
MVSNVNDKGHYHTLFRLDPFNEKSSAPPNGAERRFLDSPIGGLGTGRAVRANVRFAWADARKPPNGFIPTSAMNERAE